MGFISSVFWLLFWIAVILGAIALFSYNKLQRLAQEVKEKTSNVGVAIATKINLVNQVIDSVKNYQEAEQLVHLKISEDMNTAAMIVAYQQSNSVLASLQGLANRSPDLKASEQYHRLIDSIQECEANIQRARALGELGGEDLQRRVPHHPHGLRGEVPGILQCALPRV
jgi:LemA protein